LEVVVPDIYIVEDIKVMPYMQPLHPLSSKPSEYSSVMSMEWVLVRLEVMEVDKVTVTEWVAEPYN
jgi:hypothetical protein